MTASVSVSPASEERVDRLLARPPEGVHPGVDDEAGGPPGLRVEHPEPLGLVAVEAHLVREALGVEAPALDVRAAGVPRCEAPEVVEGRVLALERDLEVVTRDRLVVGRRGEA